MSFCYGPSKLDFIVFLHESGNKGNDDGRDHGML